jgi:starch phosphorylase
MLENPDLLAEYQSILHDFDTYLANGSDHWFHRQYATALDGPIAYFCAEYGFHESLGIYSGGLGVWPATR